MTQTGNLGNIPEDPEVLLYWEQDAYEKFGGPPLRTFEELR